MKSLKIQLDLKASSLWHNEVRVYFLLVLAIHILYRHDFYWHISSSILGYRKGLIITGFLLKQHSNFYGFVCLTDLMKQNFSSVQFSCSVVSNSLWPHELQNARPPCASPTPGVYPNSCPLSPLMAIQPSYPLCFPSPRTFNLSQHQSLFKWVTSSNQVAKVLEHQSFQWIFGTDFL